MRIQASKTAAMLALPKPERNKSIGRAAISAINKNIKGKNTLKKVFI